VALVNNAQREHQEFMGTVEAVARENGEVIRSLGAQGVAVFPSDDLYTDVWRSLAGQRRTLTFSDTDSAAHVRALTARWKDGSWQLRIATPGGEISCRLRIAGRHNIRNALAAAACAHAAGVPLPRIAEGLDAFEPVGGRSRALGLSVCGRPLTLIDDTYNANPDSVVAAIQVLAELPGPRLLVLGDMGEVGEQGLGFHLEVLRQARTSGIDAVHCTGPWMKAATEALAGGGEPVPRHWDDVTPLADHVCSLVCSDDGASVRSVLVKGSRFMRMERVVQTLQALDAPPPANKDLSNVA
jgi:UDP-N-acetylmuramoyl-tripeptide--D-alanyl-D-alanine ligase